MDTDRPGFGFQVVTSSLTPKPPRSLVFQDSFRGFLDGSEFMKTLSTEGHPSKPSCEEDTQQIEEAIHNPSNMAKHCNVQADGSYQPLDNVDPNAGNRKKSKMRTSRDSTRSERRRSSVDSTSTQESELDGKKISRYHSRHVGRRPSIGSASSHEREFDKKKKPRDNTRCEEHRSSIYSASTQESVLGNKKKSRDHTRHEGDKLSIGSTQQSELEKKKSRRGSRKDQCPTLSGDSPAIERIKEKSSDSSGNHCSLSSVDSVPPQALELEIKKKKKSRHSRKSQFRRSLVVSIKDIDMEMSANKAKDFLSKRGSTLDSPGFEEEELPWKGSRQKDRRSSEPIISLNSFGSSEFCTSKKHDRKSSRRQSDYLSHSPLHDSSDKWEQYSERPHNASSGKLFYEQHNDRVLDMTTAINQLRADSLSPQAFQDFISEGSLKFSSLDPTCSENKERLAPRLATRVRLNETDRHLTPSVTEVTAIQQLEEKERRLEELMRETTRRLQELNSRIC